MTSHLPPGAVLALDTATDVLSVAARRERQQPAVVVERGARRQAAEIVAQIDRALGRAGIGVAELDGMVVTDGPGSFTGLRISWAVAKGIAHERGVPLFTVPSLLGAAFSAWTAEGAQPGAAVASCYDALRGQVFGAVYRFSPPQVTPLVSPRVATIAQLASATPERPLAVVGDSTAVRQHGAALTAWVSRPPLDAPGTPGTARGAGEGLQPVAAAVLALAEWDGVVERLTDPATREPVYGRPAEAQAIWETRHGRPLPDSTGRAP